MCLFQAEFAIKLDAGLDYYAKEKNADNNDSDDTHSWACLKWLYLGFDQIINYDHNYYYQFNDTIFYLSSYETLMKIWTFIWFARQFCKDYG